MPVTRNTVDTMRWRDGRFEMLDQRALPAKIDYLQFDSALTVADGIRSMVVRGAPAIGCAAAYGIALEALRLKHRSPGEFRAGLEDGFTVLAASRPTAVNLFWALACMRSAWQACNECTSAQIASTLTIRAQALFA